MSADEKKHPEADIPDLDDFLDDLYSLQTNLLPNANPTTFDLDSLPHSLTDDGIHNLEIPILTDTVDKEIQAEQQLRDSFNQAQQHLFDRQPSGQPVSDEQIDIVVNKLVSRLRPKVEQLLREKLRTIVIERFKQDS
ncbi:MAG: hypothetical protein NWS22_01625 [Porticoccaceae bacterium]|nr:hypothetical protein [Alphaproteobacteria bacterium]MDP4743523.1 hypothetical protein [Porticoccaceae bacterium]MDP4752362.1 hypothetical protein [Porticoccaceae bacterium]MDP4890543.1 hypothetical protein [Porticoccaceae bacterium]MDP4988327.1 hypothetical protein [Porticoccaceae bacterium]